MGHWYIANSAAGTDTVSLGPNPTTTEDWLGVIAMEVVMGAATGTVDGHGISNQAHVAPGTNNITVSATNTGQPVFMIATTFDESGSQSPTTPGVGTGFTALTCTLTCASSYWDEVTTNFFTATIETKTLATTGSQTATFNASEPSCSSTNPDYITSEVMFDY
jgi:hypothetical protein